MSEEYESIDGDLLTNTLQKLKASEARVEELEGKAIAEDVTITRPYAHFNKAIGELNEENQTLKTEIQKLKHDISVRDQIEQWPTWKITGCDSYTIVKGSILDRLIIAEDELKAALDEVERLKGLIQSALNIKSLWTYTDVVSDENIGEAEALCKMANDFQKALNPQPTDGESK